MNKKSGFYRFISALAAATLLYIGAIGSPSASELTDNCSHCHGKNGVSTESSIPTIAGMSELYISDTMAVYKDGDRPCVEAEYPEGPDKGSKTDMCKIAKKLSDDDVAEVAKYFSGQKYVRAKQDFDAGLAAKGEKIHGAACKKCHEDGGSVAEDDAGFLAGQWMHYLKETFDHYAAGERPMPKKMQPKFEELSAEDREALLHYYASLQ